MFKGFYVSLAKISGFKLGVVSTTQILVCRYNYAFWALSWINFNWLSMTLALRDFVFVWCLVKTHLLLI